MSLTDLGLSDQQQVHRDAAGRIFGEWDRKDEQYVEQKVKSFGTTTLENCFAISTKAVNIHTYNQALLLPREIYIYAHKGNILQRAALFVIASNWKLPKCPTRKEWTHEL